MISSLALSLGLIVSQGAVADSSPNIVLVMADDQGWGQTGYAGHPFLKTPNIDSMAASGLRFDRFYAGGPTCSPTRASVMTGRTPFRTGVLEHGYPLNRNERTIAQVLSNAGYATAHFGKWHLNGYRGPGCPILPGDDHSPGSFGFGHWLSVTNFFDRDPLMSRMGEFEDKIGDSSEIIVDEALTFIRTHHKANAKQPFFTVIWYGTPHSPWVADDEDAKPFAEQSKAAQQHYGELVAMDRSIGTLRKGLKELEVSDNTLVWYCSDNGGLPNFAPESVGGLRGAKGQVFEGGLRVPAVIEWPNGIEPRIDTTPAGVVDILPTVMAVVGLDSQSLPHPIDGLDISARFKRDTGPRPKALGFYSTRERAAWVDNDWKLVRPAKKKINPTEALYNLAEDPNEETNLLTTKPKVAAKMRSRMESWISGVVGSQQGEDYQTGGVEGEEPEPRHWAQTPEYAPYLDEWSKRSEYSAWIKKFRRD